MALWIDQLDYRNKLQEVFTWYRRQNNSGITRAEALEELDVVYKQVLLDKTAIKQQSKVWKTPFDEKEKTLI